MLTLSWIDSATDPPPSARILFTSLAYPFLDAISNSFVWGDFCLFLDWGFTGSGVSGLRVFLGSISEVCTTGKPLSVFISRNCWIDLIDIPRYPRPLSKFMNVKSISRAHNNCLAVLRTLSRLSFFQFDCSNRLNNSRYFNRPLLCLYQFLHNYYYLLKCFWWSVLQNLPIA